MNQQQEQIPIPSDITTPVEEQTQENVSKGDTQEMHPYDEEIARNSLELSNTHNQVGTGTFAATGEMGEMEFQDDDFRNTLSLSGRDTEGQSLILIKSKEMIEKLKQELLDSKTENLGLQEKIMDMAHQLELAKNTRLDVQKQLLEVDEIAKTMEIMGEKVKLFQKEAETALQDKAMLVKQQASSQEQISKLKEINQNLTDLNESKDQIINKMKSEISSVLILKDEIPKILEMNNLLKEKLKERDTQLQQLATMAKPMQEHKEIEQAIQELSENLTKSKTQIEELSKDNMLLTQENERLRQVETESLVTHEQLFKSQENMQEILKELGESLKQAQDDNASLKLRLEKLQSEKEYSETKHIERETSPASNEQKVIVTLQNKEREVLEEKIEDLEREIQDLTNRDSNQRLVISKLKGETETMRQRYEERLAAVESENTQREVVNQRIGQELEYNVKSMRQLSDQFGVSFLKILFLN